jgi:hypothetical protein
MKRIIGRLGLFTLLAAFAVGCGEEDPAETDESEQSSDGVRLSDSTETPGAKVVEKKEIQKQPIGASTSCPTCGPVPDPWKSIFGPVPDPWDPPSSSTPNSGSGSKGGSGKDKP